MFPDCLQSVFQRLHGRAERGSGGEWGVSVEEGATGYGTAAFCSLSLFCIRRWPLSAPQGCPPPRVPGQQPPAIGAAREELLSSGGTALGTLGLVGSPPPCGACCDLRFPASWTEQGRPGGEQFIRALRKPAWASVCSPAPSPCPPAFQGACGQPQVPALCRCCLGCCWEAIKEHAEVWGAVWTARAAL